MATTKKTTKPAAKKTRKKAVATKKGLSDLDKNCIWLALTICIIGLVVIFFYLFQTR